MKTKDFIDFLATGAGPAPAPNTSFKLRAALLAGLATSLGVGLVANGSATPAILLASRWYKLLYALSILACGWVMVTQLARPLSRVRRSMWCLVAVVLIMAGFGVWALINAPPDQYAALLLGQSWQVCSLLIMLFSLPGLAALLWALRSLAPTRLRLAGFAAGVFAGSLGALGYSVICLENSFLFVAVWYTLGIGLSGLLGMLLGPKVLNW